MPFITQERRDFIENDELVELEPGDRCYIAYKEMVDTWRNNPRWTTANWIYIHLVLMKTRYPCDLSYNEIAAIELAWQVFFQLHVMPYELKKREENGEV